MTFNREKWDELVGRADDIEEVYAELCLGIACLDGSILLEQFELIEDCKAVANVLLSYADE